MRKLKETVARCRDIYPKVPITILSYSQGTLISTAAIQEGMKVDNWLLMGSPMDRGIVEATGRCAGVGPYYETYFKRGVRDNVKGVMVAARGDGVEPMVLSEIAGKKKLVPLDHPWVAAAMVTGICL